MNELVIRPTLKFIKMGYALVALLIVASAVAVTQIYGAPSWASYTPALFALLLLLPAERHLQRHFTRMTIAGDKLRYESGALSKSTRTIQLSKVQDVTVTQSMSQRMWAIGNLSIETAGETSRLTVRNIEGPQAIADEIIDASHRLGQPGQQGQNA